MDESTATNRRSGSLDSHVLPGGEAVTLSLAGFRSLLDLRGRAEDPAFSTAVHEVIGIGLPEGANRISEGAGRRIVWLGPDEWLVIAADGEALSLEAQLRNRLLDDPHLAVVDVSHNYTGLRLEGRGRIHVLAKGCSLDLHPRRFGPGDCAQSLLAGTRVLLCASGAGAVELWVRNSFARHLAAWLGDAMAELLDQPGRF